MDRTLNFVNDYWVKKTMPYNVTQTHSIFVKLQKNTFLIMPKVEGDSQNLRLGHIS